MPAAALLAAAAIAFGGDPHAPVLVHDRDETVLASSVAEFRWAPAGAADGPRGAVVYRREFRRPGGGVWRQYWLFYPDNRQDRGIVRTGRHIGDWELVQYRFSAAGRPVEAVYAQHSAAERCPWSEVSRRDGHPVVFVANGAHASYFAPGLRDRTWPDPNDEADGRGVALRPRVLPVTRRSPAWMAWPGRWGPTRAGLVPGEAPSPRGPAFQRDRRWSDPDRFARSARSCGARRCDERGECDGVETALAGGGVGLVLVVGGRWWWRRRRAGSRQLQH